MRRTRTRIWRNQFIHPCIAPRKTSTSYLPVCREHTKPGQYLHQMGILGPSAGDSLAHQVIPCPSRWGFSIESPSVSSTPNVNIMWGKGSASVFMFRTQKISSAVARPSIANSRSIYMDGIFNYHSYIMYPSTYNLYPIRSYYLHNTGFVHSSRLVTVL